MPENPYDSPKTLNDAEPPRRSYLGCIGAIFLIVLSIPAALIAFFTVCGVTMALPDLLGMAANGTWATISLWVGGIGGTLAFGATIWAATKMAKGK